MTERSSGIKLGARAAMRIEVENHNHACTGSDENRGRLWT